MKFNTFSKADNLKIQYDALCEKTIKTIAN